MKLTKIPYGLTEEYYSKIHDLICEHMRTFCGIDPLYSNVYGLSEEQKEWELVYFDTIDMLDATLWLYEHNITDWVWINRCPDRMVFRQNIYFKNVDEANTFKKAWENAGIPIAAREIFAVKGTI